MVIMKQFIETLIKPSAETGEKKRKLHGKNQEDQLV